MGQLQGEQCRYEKDHPSEPKKDVEQHLRDWARNKLGIVASLGTIRKAAVQECLLSRRC